MEVVGYNSPPEPSMDGVHRPPILRHSGVMEDKYTFQFEWTIENFSDLVLLKGKTFTSPNFLLEDQRDYIWYLEFQSFAQEFNLNLCLTNGGLSQGEFGTFRFIIRNASGKTVLGIRDVLDKGPTPGYHRFSKDIRNSSLPKDILKIYVEVSVYNGRSLKKEKPRPSSNSTVGFLEYVSSLWDSHVFSDFVISVGERKFPVHKVILAAHSPVFEAAFRSGLEEDKSSLLEILDFEPETVSEMIHYIYTHEEPELSLECMSELYQLADKYAVFSLKKTCQKFLLANVNDSNALNLLWLADSLYDEVLKSRVLTFINEHPASVSDTETCQAVIKSRPGLLMDILAFKTHSI